MGVLDWIKKRNEVQSNAQSNGWRTVGVYFYGPDGRYPPATWAETPQRFVEMVPKIRKHLDNKLEVRITSSDDHLLFHATKNGIEWDGIRLSEYLSREPQCHGAAKTGNDPAKGKYPERVSRKMDNDIER
jgi:hypothetical protein